MSKHTPGPWEITERSEHRICIQPKNIISPVTMSLADIHPQSLNAEANARRIVACVNALAGVTTEELESGAFKEEMSLIVQQRDELLAVLGEIAEYTKVSTIQPVLLARKIVAKYRKQ